MSRMDIVFMSTDSYLFVSCLYILRMLCMLKYKKLIITTDNAYLNFECYHSPPSCAYHWLYWCIYNERSSLKFHSRLHLGNRKSIYIFIKWCLIENGTDSFESHTVTDPPSKGQQLPERKKETTEGFH